MVPSEGRGPTGEVTATSSPGLSGPAAAVAGVPCPEAAIGGKLGAVKGNLGKQPLPVLR